MSVARTIETKQIRSEPHLEVGWIIQRDAALLVDRWSVRAHDEQPNAKRVHHEVLCNQLRDFLQAMGRALLQDGEGSPKEHRDEAIDHGEQRWDSGWSVTELVRDYQILQVVVLDHLTSTLDRPLRPRETMAVGVFINDAIAASIASYVANRDHHLRDIERAGVDALRDAQARKDAFLAMVVHELRNPVAPIVNAAEILTRQLDDSNEATRNTLRLIKRQATQLTRILDDLTDLTGMTQGRLELRREIVDVRDLIEEAIQTVIPLIQERKQLLTRDIPSQSMLVEGDPARLVQVLVNIMVNAAKYTPNGGRISVIARLSDERVEILISDNGQGIPVEMLDSVFDMYSRVRGSSDSPADGLGIGLALVKELVALHGGSVRASSEGPGRGAEFLVSIPAYNEGDAPVR